MSHYDMFKHLVVGDEESAEATEPSTTNISPSAT